MRYYDSMLPRVRRFLIAACVLLVPSAPSLAAAASVSITDPYPGTEIPVGVRVSFIALGSGFDHPTYRVVDSFPGGVTSINIDASGTFAWTPNKDDIGTHTITVTLSDGSGTEESASETIVVAAAATLTAGDPSPSAAVGPGVPVRVATSITGLFSPTYSVKDDVPSSVQSYHISQAGTFTWTPLPGDIGTHTITLTAKDQYGSSASDDVVIKVLGDPKVSVKDVSPASGVHAGSSLTFRAVASGFAAPSFAVSDTADDTAEFEIDDDTGVVSWTPATTTLGSRTLRIVAAETGRAATTTLAVTVLAPLEAQAPSASVDAAATTTGAAAPPQQTTAPASKSSSSSSKTTPTSAAPKKTAAPLPVTAATPAATPVQPQPAPVPAADAPALAEGAELAYPTPETYDVEPIPLPEYQPVFATDSDLMPSFGEFLRQKIASFFGAFAHIFGR